MAKAAALLRDYRRKRDFTRTSEPDDSGEPASASGRSFVVQKHDATRLHYDFRLEWEGVLKSWAVTRGPSYDPAEKRLAVQVEDHPLAYGGFEGTIPKGEYGGGTVMLWDRGTWEPVGDFAKGLKDGKLVFQLAGERLKGEWTLVRMQRRPGEKRDNWLMIKHREDGGKVPRGDVLKKHVKSVASGRSMAEIASGGRTIAGSDVAQKKAKGQKAAMPRFRAPQLATLVDEAPDGDGWLSELKYDGYRALVAIAGGKAKVFTRNGLDWTDKFPGVAAAAARLRTDGSMIDGEIVAFDGQGRTDFSALQKSIKAGGKNLTFFAFDLLDHDGEDLRSLPLTERKERLQTLLGAGSAPLVFSPHVGGSAAAVLHATCQAGHEGIVVKRAADPYRSGRGRSWLKVKCTRRQEFVVGGWTPSDKRGRKVKSILIGLNEGGKLVYKGRVGAFEGATLADLEAKIAPRRRKTAPFAAVPADVRRTAQYLTPDLVAEIDFAEFTSDGIVRHGVFKGLRADKDAVDVVLETPKELAMTGHETRDVFAGVKLSSPDKVLYPEQGVTKADLAAHYERVAPRMLPLVTNRLLSLVRCPDGASGQCFFQKHDHKGFREELKRLEIEEKDGGRDRYLYAEDVSGLIAGVQMGTLEFHIWGSHLDRLEQPDRLVFDLDPDEGLGFADVRDASFDLRDRLDSVGLKSVAMVTGGKGVHVIVPLTRRPEWPDVKAFARGFAEKVASDQPDRYVSQASKAKRKGKIFVDWLRNERGSTAIAPYSTRARKGAPVATPVSWGELKSIDAANAFHIGDMDRRLAQSDPWKDLDGWRQSVTKAMLKAVESR